MKNKKILAIISALAIASTLMISFNINAENSENSDTYSLEISEDTSTDETSESVQETSTDELTLLSYNDYPEEYLKNIVIVGDSIASGFSTYDRLPSEQVLAVGSVGARNIHSFDFTVNGESMDILDAISIVNPQYIFMSMGMNDINLSTSEEYIANYSQNIDDILNICTNSTIIVMGITPITAYTDFSTNEEIDTYNEALKLMAKSYRDIGKKVYYINVSRYLKDEQNNLKTEFSSGDGIHLAQSTYDYIFTSMMSSLEWIQ